MTRKRSGPSQPHLLDLCPTYLTRAQASVVAGVSTRTIDRWLRDPVVPLKAYRRPGRGRRPVLLAREELRTVLTLPVADGPKPEAESA